MITIADLVGNPVFMPEYFIIKELQKDVIAQMQKEKVDQILLDSLVTVLEYYMPEQDFEDWYNVTFSVGE